MGLREVLLGRSKETGGLSRCARVDSLGLAKRRLAAKAAKEEPAADAADAADADGVRRDRDNVPTAQEPLDQDDKDESEAFTLTLMGRQHRDSLRIHRRRFRERASLDIPSSVAKNAGPEKGISWSSGGLPTQGGQDEEQEDDGGDGATHQRASCPTNAIHQVRFRRASDGEYLSASRSAHKASEGAIPHALKAVQAKAERLFRRLTANFVTESTLPPRLRSASHSRGGSPTRPQRVSAGRIASVSRSSASWGLGLRHRSVDASSASGPGVDGADGTAATETACTAAATDGGSDDSGPGDAGGHRQRRRAQRKSAPGELFFTPIAGGGAVTGPEPGSPPLSPSDGTQRARSLTKDVAGSGAGSAAAGGSTGKGRKWLARLSRGLSPAHGPHAYKATAAAAAGPGPTGGSMEIEAVNW